MLRKDILLIINPKASKGHGKKKAKEIQSLFREFGRECTVAYTRAQGHAESLAKRAALYGYDTIVAAGGDGTVNETVNGIMRSKVSGVRMGIIPIGRGNDFAWMAGIPHDQKKAVKLIADGKSIKIDVGFCAGTDHPDGLYFINGVGLGFEPMVNFRAMEYKHINGMLSYAVAFLYILKHPPKAYSLKLDIDGKIVNLETQQVSISNGRRMGSAFIIAPLAEIDDGQLDVMFTNFPLERKGLIKAVISFLKGSQVIDKETFTYMKARRINIVSEENRIESHYDGEVFSHNGMEFQVEIKPGALELINGKIKKGAKH